MIPLIKQTSRLNFEHSLKYCTTVSANTKKSPKPPRVSTKITTPRLPKEYIETVRNVTGIHVGTSGVSWALLNLSHENKHYLVDWNHHAFPPNTQKLHIYELCKLIFEVQNTLPESDIYVTESLNPVIRTNTNPVQHGALELIAQLQSMLCVALSQPGSNLIDTPKLVFLKNRLTAKIFNLLIKSECITSRHIIENIVQSQTLSDSEFYADSNESYAVKNEIYAQKDEIYADQSRVSPERSPPSIVNEGLSVGKQRNFHTRIIMEPECIANYDRNRGYSQESMAISLLYAICLSDLIISPNPSLLERLYTSPADQS
ncbi:hypothetical protein M8J75_016048 [Diaphorina citri]|nr:hypothetical protein M8J75_016048 [Diaphorina citri]